MKNIKHRFTLFLTLSAFLLSVLSISPVYSSATIKSTPAMPSGQNMAMNHGCPDHLVISNNIASNNVVSNKIASIDETSKNMTAHNVDTQHYSKEKCCDDEGISHSCCGATCSGLYSTINSHILQNTPISKLAPIQYINPNASPSLLQAPFRPPIS